MLHHHLSIWNRRTHTPSKYKEDMYMGFNSFYFVGFLFLSVFSTCAYSSRISDVELGSHGRSLLQTPTSCPVDFENQNYTIITSKCRGPKFPADICCSAFKEFACPFVDEIDDTTTNCATTMFTYISLYGKYPPGLFANECKEGKLGLDCLNVTSYNATNSPKNSAHTSFSLPPLASVYSSTVAFFLFLMLSTHT